MNLANFKVLEHRSYHTGKNKFWQGADWGKVIETEQDCQ